MKISISKDLLEQSWQNRCWMPDGLVSCQYWQTKLKKLVCWLTSVNPNGTTQDCSNCGEKVPKKLHERWHGCQGGCELERDHNAATNIKNRAVGHPVF